MKDFFNNLNASVFCVLDTETTGLSPENGDRIVEISVYKIKINGNSFEITDKFYHKINPERNIPFYVSRIHGIYNKDVTGCPFFSEITDDFIKFISDEILVIQNAGFDLSFINNELKLSNRCGINNSVIDTIYLSKLIYRNERRHNLDIICERLNIKKDIQRHSAEGDVIITTEAFVKMRNIILNI